jgi:hydrogenase nickel incorporation protein HypA/HybF
MHELAICTSLLQEVERVARERDGHRVVSIVVRVGPLSGVEPGLLERAYSVASAGSCARGAALVIEEAPVRVRCRECDACAGVKSNDLTCPHCGSWRTELLSGDELLLTRVELERLTEVEEPAHV